MNEEAYLWIPGRVTVFACFELQHVKGQCKLCWLCHPYATVHTFASFHIQAPVPANMFMLATFHHKSNPNNVWMNEACSWMGCEMGLNQVAKMGIILEPFILLLLRESLIPDTHQWREQLIIKLWRNWTKLLRSFDGWIVISYQ